MARILISAVGSLGDVIPFIRLGRALARRGHDVRIYAAEAFRLAVEGAGLRFRSTGQVAALQDSSNQDAPRDTRAGLQKVSQGIADHLVPTMRAMEADVEEGRTLLVGSTFAFSPRLLSELRRLPFAAVHLAPSAFRSDYLAPRFSPLGHFERWPRAFKRGMWRAMDLRFLDPAFAVPLNAARERFGLPPVHRVLHDWVHQGAVTLGLFPQWFAPKQPDWPDRVALTGFPLEHRVPAAGLDARLAAFLAAGSRPVVFTPGTAPSNADAFFEASARACERLGLRAVFVTRDESHAAAAGRSSVLVVREAPFDLLLKQCCAVVHHGGIGTLSEALRAGVPQLIRPVAFDQFDNASRARRLGVASELLAHQYRGGGLERALSRLLESGAVKRSCKLAAEAAAEQDGVASAVEMLERALLAPHYAPLRQAA